MFFKQICIIFVILGILGYIYGDWIFYRQACYMLNMQYTIPAYEACERIIKYYPKSRYCKFARETMDTLRKTSRDLQSQLAKNEEKYRKEQKIREEKESYR